MRRKKSKAPGAFYTFIISLFLLISNYQSAVQRIKFLFFRTPISLRKLQFIWSTDPSSLISVAVFLLLILIAVVSFFRFLSQMKKLQRGAPSREAAPKPEAVEDALHCDHKRGKEKYLQQLDSFLRCGVIDRAEYRTLRARYEKLDIDDDYH